jgi:hypothetical protein
LITALTQAQVVNGVVPISAICGEVGRHRAITLLRPAAPLAVAVALGPLFVRSIATQGVGLAVELAGVAAGLVGGFAALSLMSVFRGEAGRAASRAGWPYAAVWIAVFGARAVFSYGCVHWFPGQLAQWRLAHHVPPGVLTDALIFMAEVMLVICPLGTVARAIALTYPATGIRSREEKEHDAEP